jgi:hypothetical protein
MITMYVRIAMRSVEGALDQIIIIAIAVGIKY